jgi:hypothetical protein
VSIASIEQQRRCIRHFKQGWVFIQNSLGYRY